MHIWIPQLNALTCAENANHSLHNIQTLRGARTRDARNFARYLDETPERRGADAQVHFGPPARRSLELIMARCRIGDGVSRNASVCRRQSAMINS